MPRLTPLFDGSARRARGAFPPTAPPIRRLRIDRPVTTTALARPLV